MQMKKIQTLISIERAAPLDLDWICELLKNYDLTLAGIEDVEFWLARDDAMGKEPKACIGLEMRGKNGLLRSLAVKKEYQISGIGSRLVLHILELARERKLENLLLFTMTAKDFFSKFGFVPVARASVEREEISKSREFEACSTSSTLMQLNVSQ